jgi:hypothetical protein
MMCYMPGQVKLFNPSVLPFKLQIAAVVRILFILNACCRMWLSLLDEKLILLMFGISPFVC